MNAFAHTSCIILSAGGSGRMGMHKALLGFGDEQVTFLEKITKAYAKAGIAQTIVVVNNDLHKSIIADQPGPDLPGNVRIVINARPELGRFNSLLIGMGFVKAGSHVFFQNVDNPFVDLLLLKEMIAQKDRAEVVVPMFSGVTGHPVLIGPLLCKAMAGCDDPEMRIDQFLKKFSFFEVESSDRSILVNINTLSDYNNEFPGNKQGL